MSELLLKNIKVNGKLSDVLICGSRISRIADAGTSTLWTTEVGTETIDCHGMTAIPGFVNMHTHSAMSVMRGVGEDIIFRDWIDRIWKLEENLDYDFVYQAAKVACLEMIKSGTTTFNDQYWFFQATRQAAADLGLRSSLGYDFMDKGNPAEVERQKEQCLRTYSQAADWKGDTIYTLSFHAVYSVSEPMIVWASDFAKSNGLRLHIHLSETRAEVEDCKALHGGLSPVEYLDSLGVLGPWVIAAHTLWLSENDVRILGMRGVSCVHNINSNAKLASGYRFLYQELRNAGANICIGTDGCASSNNVDMLEAMKTAALFQKAWRDDPKAMPLDELLDCATVNGAKALGIEAGRIAEGALADICIVDTDNTYFLSPGSFNANLVYSAHSDCIDSVIAGGRIVMRHRYVEGEEDILKEARKLLCRISR